MIEQANITEQNLKDLVQLKPKVEVWLKSGTQIYTKQFEGITYDASGKPQGLLLGGIGKDNIEIPVRDIKDIVMRISDEVSQMILDDSWSKEIISNSLKND